MELLRLFDENYQFVEVKSREFAHSKSCKLYHEVVHIILINNKNQVLLQKRSATKKEHPNLWDLSVTGHVSSSDNLYSACVRETFEEIGLNFKQADFEKLKTIRDDLGKEFINIFLCKKQVDENTKFVFSDNEVSEVKFFSKTELHEMLYSAEYSPYFSKYKKVLTEIFDIYNNK